MKKYILYEEKIQELQDEITRLRKLPVEFDFIVSKSVDVNRNVSSVLLRVTSPTNPLWDDRFFTMEKGDTLHLTIEHLYND